MENLKFRNISAEALRSYIEQNEEKDYLIVDVRQPVEYAQSHIPGAKLVPLMNLESALPDLPSEQDIIFYCRSGNRSQAGAAIAAGSGISLQQIYNLRGGIMAWDGKTLSDFPRVQAVTASESPADMLLKSMDLEKGALRFYRYVLQTFADQPFVKTIKPLVDAEEAHARSIYRFWRLITENPEPFDALFARLTGDILEGGENLHDAISKVEIIEENFCLNLFELALEIEFRAYDVYRTMANMSRDDDASHVFLSIAQIEKDHMQLLAETIAECPELKE
ncbi:MAG: rhodanese-like domain-containing protein [Desulfobacterales bacterium]|jgi:rhodanese-related sulfurtransferase/rubrerythrin